MVTCGNADYGGIRLLATGVRTGRRNLPKYYQSGYVLGEKINYLHQRILKHGDFKELDRGFDFYAPQTMVDPEGLRLLLGWMELITLCEIRDNHIKKGDFFELYSCWVGEEADNRESVQHSKR